MGTHFIQGMTAKRGAVDRLEWQVRIATDFDGPRENRAFAVHWEAEVAFYREAIASSTVSSPRLPRIALAARSMNSERSARLVIPQEKMFEFATELPGDALDRIEAFREGGRLFARLEGRLLLVYRSGERAERLGPWFDELFRLMEEGRGLSAEVRSECKELTRDPWCTDVLASLRAPGRVIIEVILAPGTATEPHGKRAVEHLTSAQAAFDDGRYQEAARLVYKAGEALQQLGGAVEARYGELAQKQVARQNSSLQALCHPERHDQAGVVGGHETDRPMALHLITSMKSLTGVYLAR